MLCLLCCCCFSTRNHGLLVRLTCTNPDLQLSRLSDNEKWKIKRSSTTWTKVGSDIINTTIMCEHTRKHLCMLNENMFGHRLKTIPAYLPLEAPTAWLTGFVVIALLMDDTTFFQPIPIFNTLRPKVMEIWSCTNLEFKKLWIVRENATLFKAG